MICPRDIEASSPTVGAMITYIGINSKQGKRKRTLDSNLIWIIETPKNQVPATGEHHHPQSIH